MMKALTTRALICLLLLQLLGTNAAYAQPWDKEQLFSKETLKAERLKRADAMWKYTIGPVIGVIPTPDNEDRFRSALWAIGQFMLKNDTTKQILDSLFKVHSTLGVNTKRALMEVVYGLYPKTYTDKVRQLWPVEKEERVKVMMWMYLYRNGLTNDDRKAITQELFRISHNVPSALMEVTMQHLSNDRRHAAGMNLNELVAYFQQQHIKVIYSLQRADRNYPGMAVIQNADGSFVKDEQGRLKGFVQLARSASDLPYFITNGSTPQGLFRIAGTEVSKNLFIGPTPNIQLRMPLEVPADSFFLARDTTIGNDTTRYMAAYAKLLPENWRNDLMMESFNAGKVGRSEIIAHGTTIDPEYFKGYPFYPCTPTLGCLCATEIWDPQSGKPAMSEQLALANAFFSTPGKDGYLIVINLDDQAKPVTMEDVLKRMIIR